MFPWPNWMHSTVKSCQSLPRETLPGGQSICKYQYLSWLIWCQPLWCHKGDHVLSQKFGWFRMNLMSFWAVNSTCGHCTHLFGLHPEFKMTPDVFFFSVFVFCLWSSGFRYFKAIYKNLIKKSKRPAEYLLEKVENPRHVRIILLVRGKRRRETSRPVPF